MYLPTYIKPVVADPAETYNERYIANLSQALSEHPEDELQLRQQMLIYMQVTDRKDETIDLALELLAKDTKGIYASDCYIILARVYTDKKEVAKAIEYYRKTIALDPSVDDPILELASLYEDQLNYDAAIELYDSLNDENFGYVQVEKNRNKGFCYYKKKEFEKALVCYQTALNLLGDEQDVNLHNNIGGCFFNMNNFTEAFSRFRMSLEIDPQSAVAHYGLGLCYQHTDDGYRALHHYFEAIKIKPDYTEAYNNIAAITINEEGDYNVGIEMLQRAIDNCPNKESLTIIYINLSRVYNGLKEFALADYYKSEYMKSLGFGDLFDEVDDDDD